MARKSAYVAKRLDGRVRSGFASMTPQRLQEVTTAGGRASARSPSHKGTWSRIEALAWYVRNQLWLRLRDKLRERAATPPPPPENWNDPEEEA